MSTQSLRTLAAAAGVMVDWVDASDQPRQVCEPSLQAVLAALELPAATAAQREDSLRRCQAQAAEPAALLTVQVGEPLVLRVAANASGRWIDDDSGAGCNFVARDVTGDGKVDIFTTNKRGTFLHVQR